MPKFGPRVPAAALERLWTMRQGTVLNASDLARALEISAPAGRW
ncbi:MAG TPA: hypothetical protein VFR34_07020 [Paracoccaceae bacterium]|nr:hypothetical protein [Paracoccaceae bacterium]